MNLKVNKDNHLDFSQLDVQKLYDTLAKIIGERENLIIKYTVTKKEEYKKENK